mmetsp:Transcript_26755/g.54083  ORF Transcript_26755/g.54083 Transcript_26755/m.54083 type:complete len:263 (-) Transcript_26755:438-1226(-)
MPPANPTKTPNLLFRQRLRQRHRRRPPSHRRLRLLRPPLPHRPNRIPPPPNPRPTTPPPRPRRILGRPHLRRLRPAHHLPRAHAHLARPPRRNPPRSRRRQNPLRRKLHRSRRMRGRRSGRPALLAPSHGRGRRRGESFAEIAKGPPGGGAGSVGEGRRGRSRRGGIPTIVRVRQRRDGIRHSNGGAGGSHVHSVLWTGTRRSGAGSVQAPLRRAVRWTRVSEGRTGRHHGHVLRGAREGGGDQLSERGGARGAEEGGCGVF